MEDRRIKEVLNTKILKTIKELKGIYVINTIISLIFYTVALALIQVIIANRENTFNVIMFGLLLLIVALLTLWCFKHYKWEINHKMFNLKCFVETALLHKDEFESISKVIDEVFGRIKANDLNADFLDCDIEFIGKKKKEDVDKDE